MGTIALIPNMVTLANLLLGIISLIYIMNGDFTTAAILILIAVVLDGLDGKLARKLNVETNFGKELDSLCDLVSFGVAPALLVYTNHLQNFSHIGLVISLAFAVCGAIRLARFNVINITTHFIGMPITLAGGIVAIAILLSNFIPLVVFAILTVLLSYLMVSNFKVPKY